MRVINCLLNATAKLKFVYIDRYYYNAVDYDVSCYVPISLRVEKVECCCLDLYTSQRTTRCARGCLVLRSSKEQNSCSKHIDIGKLQ